MPRRKQPRVLSRAGPGGARLARRKQRISFGKDRQLARSDDVLHDAIDPAVQARYDEAAAWHELLEEWHREERLQYSDAEFEDYVEQIYPLLGELTIQRALLDAFPEALRSQWQQQRAAQTDAPAPQRRGLEARILSPWRAQGEALRDQIRRAVGRGHNASVVNRIAYAHQQPRLAESLFYFAPLWTRQPATFTGTTVRELLDHLFVRYPVPECLYSAWEQPRHHLYPNQKWRHWFLVFALGGSLKAAGALAAGWSVHRRFAHYFAQVPAEVTPQRGTQLAELARLNIAPAAVQMLLSHDGYVFDLSAVWGRNDARHIAFWQNTARWLDQHHAELTGPAAHRVLSWARHAFAYHDNFSWSGRTVATVMEHARIHAQARAKPGSVSRWESHDMDWSGLADKPGLWQIEELTSSAQLDREGAGLHHCIGSYAQQCMVGRSAVFSMRRTGQPTITIEIDPGTGTVLQARGARNRACSVEEQWVMQQWLAEVVLPRCKAAS